ncbi:MAG: aminodeoxychorismate synthase component I [Desulfitobacteriaceae bacterium]
MIFILDNFDSFTFNLYQYFGELGEDVVVKRRDECNIAYITALNPELIVISPGPCTPNEALLSLEVIRIFGGHIPILGVCLGHQAIGQVFGAQVVRARLPVHGKTAAVKHDGQGVFQDLPHPLTVTRYHSLVLERSSFPAALEVTAETDEGEIMGIRHRTLPLEGVQFHPEAILTAAGHKLLQNALTNARAWLQAQAPSPWKLEALSLALPPRELFHALHSTPYPFFLDSGEDYGELGRYSFLGADPFVIASAYPDRTEIKWLVCGQEEIFPATTNQSLDILNSLTAKFRAPSPPLFPFAGGAVGYFSYDLKDELEELPQQAQDDLALPLWRFGWYDGILIYDHFDKLYHLAACGLTEEGECSELLAYQRISRLKEILLPFLPHVKNMSPEPEQVKVHPRPIALSVKRKQYLSDLKHVIEYIYAGDIYQANLTQRFSLSFAGDPWQLYRDLHDYNPAPFAAFLPYPDFQILSSSPERFIKIEPDGKIETRPIKGTRPRGDSDHEDRAQAEELWHSQKDRAELTMIIDLERNDLGRISRFGTVRVPDLIRLEKYPTVWHLVSTVSGQLQSELTPKEILHAIFPGGSITGAPKIRAMEIIDELEPFKRGIYTGSIGYLGFDGAWDLNIVIRTIILKDGQAYLHAGGGIVADSIPELEYEETLSKAQALFKVLKGVLPHA